jgi:deoxyribose-phosphate aldolase
MNLSRYIDHTILKPETTSDQVIQICKEAIENNFFAVCVNSSYVPLCAQQLKNTTVKIASVVGFPLGVLDTASKAYETALAIKNGATEIDMVIHVGALKEKNYKYVQDDITAIVAAAAGNKVKVILETALLTDEEKKIACELALKAKAHFVKTCTGFGGGGATVEDIQLMKSVVGSQMEIKASGGVKTAAFAQDLIAAGATRLGTSSGIALIENKTVQPGTY